jgi:hypothetical protein
MKWRVIIRISLDGDQGSAIRNNFEELFKECGIQNTGTGVWETAAGEPVQIALKLQEIILTLANIDQSHPGDKSVNLDHLWMYIATTDPAT